jgi:nitroimidazol reductase NimA-like FMN-containing flavoprotein (pyridoxamine 5'-phosphate oxidase superfamily)
VHESRVFELTEAECHARLERHEHRLGRLAFAENGDPYWPTVLPVNYAYQNGEIFIRTVEGSKLYAALRRQRVAFEVDEVDLAWNQGWSVVALGTLEIVRDDEQRAVIDAVLRSWATQIGEQLMRLDVDQLTGREIVG